MNRSKAMFCNLLLMTGVSLFIKFVSLSFNVYVTGKIGAGGIGLYSLIMSVGGFAVTFAVSGINYGATRLVAEAVGENREGEIKGVMSRCILYGICFGVGGGLLVNMIAEPLCSNFLSDRRCILPLRILSISLPFMALSSALSGYFNAVRRVYKNAIIQISQQFISIGATVYLLGILLPKGVEYACVALILGGCVAEALSFLINYTMYKIDVKGFGKSGRRNQKGRSKKLMSVCLPVAFSSYVRSGLVSVEHMLIPIGLRKYGVSDELSLESYGVLQGMVFPVIFFPMSIMSAFAGLLIPEIAESRAAGEKGRVDNIVSRVFQISLCFGVGVAGLMICFSDGLGMLIYKSKEAGILIKAMAPLIPVMYLDHVVDGMLKGMGEQLYSMRVNIFDASLSVVLVYLMLPHFGLYGYIVIIYAMEIINASLSISRIFKCCNSKIEIVKWLIKPLASIILSCFVAKKTIALLLFEKSTLAMNTAGGFALGTALYICFLFLTQAITLSDLKRFRKAMK